jgi:hypothetical protein
VIPFKVVQRADKDEPITKLRMIWRNITELKASLAWFDWLIMEVTYLVIGSYGGRFFTSLLPPDTNYGAYPLSLSFRLPSSSGGNVTSMLSREF